MELDCGSCLKKLLSHTEHCVKLAKTTPIPYVCARCVVLIQLENDPNANSSWHTLGK